VVAQIDWAGPRRFLSVTAKIGGVGKSKSESRPAAS
jgi:hypothetical protein